MGRPCPSSTVIGSRISNSRLRYGLAATLLFFVEIVIAIYVHDNFVRPFFGDVLVVVLLYALAQTVVLGRPVRVIAGVVGFAFFMEVRTVS